ncbi:MAG: hypothetical protein ACE5EX_00120 [Phycisphaerae bacterium]
MGHFLYFLPGVESVDTEMIERSGLSDRIDGDHFTRTAGATAGPAEGRGVIVSRGDHGCAYKPDVQSWSGPFGPMAVWIGFYRNDRPGPAELARNRQLRGHEVELLDGRRWMVPAAIYAPSALVIVGGELVHKPLEVKRRLWGRVEEISEQFFATNGDGGVPWERSLEIAAEALAVNYRVSADSAGEMSALELISTDNIGQILEALMDLPRIASELQADAKKKDTACVE